MPLRHGGALLRDVTEVTAALDRAYAIARDGYVLPEAVPSLLATLREIDARLAELEQAFRPESQHGKLLLLPRQGTA